MEQNKQDSNKREAERAAIQAHTIQAHTIPLQDRRPPKQRHSLKHAEKSQREQSAFVMLLC